MTKMEENEQEERKLGVITSGTTPVIRGIYEGQENLLSKPRMAEWIGSTLTTSGDLINIRREIDAKITERLDEINKSIPDIITHVLNNQFEDLLDSYFKGVSQIPTMRDPDLEWIASHPEELNKFQGKYIAIADGKIVGSGESLSEARSRAKKNAPNKEPMIMGVSDSDFGL